MKRPMFAVVLAFVCSMPAVATVDAYISYVVPYRHLHTDSICLTKLPLLAELGIPEGVAMKASLLPAQVRRYGSLGSSQVDINLLAQGYEGALTVDASDYDEVHGIVSAAVTLDLHSVSDHNGDSLSGRTRTIHWAKLAIITLSENMKQNLWGSYHAYKLRVRIAGLPSQSGIQGARVYETTRFPYTEGSELLRDYRSELINVHGECRDNIH